MTAETEVQETRHVDTATGEIVPAGSQVAEFRALYNPELDFRRLAMEADYFSKGFRLLDDKSMLIGVPHVIVNATFREGYLVDRIQGDYVSVEAVVADKDTLSAPQFRTMLPDPLAVFPNEAIVYNDGGTGIRRELVKLFHEIGLIDVGDGGEEGDRRFDRPMSLWKSGADLAATGITADTTGRPFRYVVMRGLRRSDYDSPYGPATTYYFG